MQTLKNMPLNRMTTAVKDFYALQKKTFALPDKGFIAPGKGFYALEKGLFEKKLNISASKSVYLTFSANTYLFCPFLMKTA